MAGADTNFLDFETHVYFMLVIIGFGVGWVGGFAGIGGAPFMVALIRLLVGFCQHEAQGTVLAVMLPPMSLMGVYAMKDRAYVMRWFSFSGFVTYAIFSYGGAELAYVFEGKVLSVLFGTFLLILSVKYVYQYIQSMHAESVLEREVRASHATKVGKEAEVELDDKEELNKNRTDSADVDVTVDSSSSAGKPRQTADEAVAEAVAARRARRGSIDIDPNKPTIQEGFPLAFNHYSVAIVGSFVGVVGGLFGVGAGVLMVPIFTDLFGLHKNDARVLSLSILLPPVSAGAVIRYAQDDAVNWIMALVLFCLYFCSNYPGAQYGKKVKTRIFKPMLGALLGILGAVIILFAYVDNPIDPEAAERCRAIDAA